MNLQKHAFHKAKLLGQKEFAYRVRIQIPEKSGKMYLYPYTQCIKSLVDRLCIQLKTQGRTFLSGGITEGYDRIRGKYLEQSIIAFVINTTAKEKIIWITNEN